MSPDADDGTRELDVREIDGEPFDDITAALDSLPVGETLVLVNSSEPEPLYDVLERRELPGLVVDYANTYATTDPKPGN